MKQALTILLVISILSVFGQETKKVKNKIEKYIYEEYHVLQSDKSIKQGNYKRYSFKYLDVEGYYNNGKKDSLWTEYGYKNIVLSKGKYISDKKNGVWTECFENGTTKNKGNYKNDERIGIWEFYNSQSQLINKYNYDTRELIYHKPERKAKNTNEESFVKTSNGIEKMKLDQNPVYLGSEEEIMKIFLQHMTYPKLARETGVSGTVLISFYITPEGKAVDHAIEQGIGAGCDEEALRVVKLIPDQWVPGMINGEAVTVKFVRPVRYSLQ